MNYTFIEHIANGGFGKVEKVKGDDGKYYAKKTFELDPKMIADGLEDNAKKRFIQEALFQANITHKNVVPVIEVFVKENPPYFIMPLAETTLDKESRAKIIDSSNFMGAILDILSGLEEIHSLDIFHRDLKPSNVLKFRIVDGPSYYAISDFGLMSIQQRTGLTSLTSTGMGKNSDLYTAPEITQHLKSASAPSDIYSVGCIIHDFVGTGSRVACNEIVDHSPYSDILSICTKFDPKKRFKNIASLRDILATIDSEIFESKTETGTKITEYLNRIPLSLTEKEIEEIADYINDDAEVFSERKNVLLQIDLAHIEIIKKSSIINHFSSTYCDFIKESSFQWSSCDALATRIEKMTDGENLTVQSNGIMALLYMGTSHNRWFVEKMFTSKVGVTANTNLMKRLNMEFVVDGRKVCNALDHLTFSIGYSLDLLHPILRATFEKIC